MIMTFFQMKLLIHTVIDIGTIIEILSECLIFLMN
jgi:hypothetical protein